MYIIVKEARTEMFLFSDHAYLLDHGIDQLVQLQKARYVYSGSDTTYIIRLVAEEPMFPVHCIIRNLSALHE